METEAAETLPLLGALGRPPAFSNDILGACSSISLYISYLPPILKSDLIQTTFGSLTAWCKNLTTIWKIRVSTLTYTMGTLSDWGFYSQTLAHPSFWTLRSCLCQCARLFLPSWEFLS